MISFQHLPKDNLPTREDLRDRVEAAYTLGVQEAIDKHGNVVLTPEQKRKILRDVKSNKQRLGELNEELADTYKQLDRHKWRLSIAEDTKAWTDGRPHVLERAENSQIHKLIEGLDVPNSVDALDEHEDGANTDRAWAKKWLPEAMAFVVQHDWASAFAGATDFDAGEFHLPANPMAVEFQYGGCRLIILIIESDGQFERGGFLRTKSGWAILTPQECDLVPTDDEWEFMWSQIRAMCIALESEVAETEIVRAPHKLNAARERRGHLPIRDYHVVSLMRRERAKPLPDPTGRTHRSPRLHFRRGHWRHYETHKTWIRWTLVGNPSLGFIDKEYRL